MVEACLISFLLGFLYKASGDVCIWMYVGVRSCHNHAVGDIWKYMCIGSFEAYIHGCMGVE